MMGFSFVDAAGKGYQFVWEERQALFSLAVLPLAVKMGCFAIIILLGLQDNHLRQGLMLLPAYFLEGWLAALCIRLAIFGERRAQGAEGLFVAEPLKQVILASALVYTLTKLATSFFAALVVAAGSVDSAPPETNPPAGAYFVLVVFTVFCIWAFRFFWLYVPVAMNVPPSRFLKRIRPFSASFSLLGLWLVCMVPAAVLLMGFSSLLKEVFFGGADAGSSMAYLYGMSCFEGVIETIVVLVASAGMAFGIQSLFNSQDRIV